MKNLKRDIKSLVAAILVTLALVAGLILAGAPAQAVWGNSIRNVSTNGKSICYVMEGGGTYCSSPNQVMYSVKSLVLPPRSCVYTSWAAVQCSQAVTRWLTVPGGGSFARMH